MTEIGYLDMNGDDTAGEVHLSGSGSKVPIGRVIVDGQSKKSIGTVEVLTSDIDDETEKPHYVQCGYISFGSETSVDEYGYIYKHQKGKKKKELIGYCARPSDPNTPTIYGERSWRTLWLVTTLNAYSGKPDMEEMKADIKQNKAVFIGNDTSSPEFTENASNANILSDNVKEVSPEKTFTESQTSPLENKVNANPWSETEAVEEAIQGSTEEVVENQINFFDFHCPHFYSSPFL